MECTPVEVDRQVWRRDAVDGGAMRRVPAVVLLVLAMGLALLPASSSRTADRTWVVDAGTALPAAARVISELPFIDSLIVSSPVAIQGAVAVDTELTPQSLVLDATSGIEMDEGVQAVGAPEVWTTNRGARAVVALIDTGVADVDALEGAVAGEIDFTGTGGGDGHGHGTFLASMIAGRAQGTNPASGVAPAAGVLSLKVADAEGDSNLGTVLAALQWLHGPGSSAGIRIAALALAVDAGTEGALLLERAVDQLAARGVLVITATGNDHVLTSPATSTTSLSVGSTAPVGGQDDANSDGIADFSGGGPDRAGVAQPDVVAPGISVVGTLPSGSVLATAPGVTATPDGLYTGSGTSMATAIAAGVAALASDARPDLGGAALAAAFQPYGRSLDARSVVAAALAAPSDGPGQGSANGNGSGNGNGNGQGNVNPNGNGNGNAQGNGNGAGAVADPQSVRWTSVRWTSVRWTSVRWTGAGWGDSNWGVAAWGSVRWTGATWESTEPQPQSVRWTSVRWTRLS